MLNHSAKCSMPGISKSHVMAINSPVKVIVKNLGTLITDDSFTFTATNGIDLINKIRIHYNASTKDKNYLVCDMDDNPLGWININTGGFVMQDQIDWINRIVEFHEDMTVVLDD